MSEEFPPDDEIVKQKKSRGRPTSKKSIASAMVTGITTTRQSADTCCELVSNQPQIFKKLPDILKAFNQLKCWIRLLPHQIEINLRDHLRHSHNKLYMPADAMVSYFLDPDAPIAWINHTEDKDRPDSMHICCSRENLLEICKDVGDDFFDFRIIVMKSVKKWYISIADKHGCTEVNEVPRPVNMGHIPALNSPEAEAEAFDYTIDKNYGLFFDITSDKLKNIVTRANGANITFSKMTDSKNIKIESAPPNGVPFWNVFNDPVKINLVQNVPDEEYVVISVNSDHMKIAANTSIQFMKTVRIGMSAGKPLSIKWFSLDIDNRETCVLHSYVDIVKTSGSL